METKSTETKTTQHEGVTYSGTPVATIRRMEADDLARWQRYLKEIGSVPWGSNPK